MRHASCATPAVRFSLPGNERGRRLPGHSRPSEKEAAVRLKAEGPNTLPQADRRTFLRIVLEILREPMFAPLLGAAQATRRWGVRNRRPRAASGEIALWLLDGVAAAHAQKAGEESANLRALIDAIPIPMWRRDRDRALVE